MKNKVMVDLEAYIRRDFMVKRSLMKSRLIKTENYKSRWFVLTKDFLCYCDGTLQDGPGKLKGFVELYRVRVVEAVDMEALKGLYFQVVYHDEDEKMTLYIQAVHTDQQLDWIRDLKKAAFDAGATMDSTYHPGIWRSVEFTCCYAVNKRAVGCKQMTYVVAGPETGSSKSSASETASTPSLPVAPRKKPPVEPPQPSTMPAAEPPVYPRAAKPSTDVAKQSTDVSRPQARKPAAVIPPRPPPKARPGKPRKMVFAVYDFEAVETEDLSLKMGEEYELLETDGGWYKVKNKDGEQGYVPSNYVAMQSDGETPLSPAQELRQYEWYYPDILRPHAEEILRQDGMDGCFLVRDSRTAGSYSLSLFSTTVTSNGGVKHYQIKKTDKGQFYILDGHAFDSLSELIVYHKCDIDGFSVVLKSPPKSFVRLGSIDTPAGLHHETKAILISELTIMEELGTGKFSKVVRGKYKGTVDVAIKMLKEGTMSESDFVAEANTMTTLKHKNLVQLYGVCTQAQPLYIVTEYMKYGSLQRFLRRNKHKVMSDTPRLLDVASQICSAMVYLESMRFVHRDLAARNCLVGENTIVKVADFGLARFVVDNEYNLKAGSKFPIRWSAPEVLQQCKYSIKSDVWSYGVLLWEIFSCGEKPYVDVPRQELVDFICSRSGRLSCPDNCLSVLYDTMLGCWALEPEMRPSFVDLSRSIETLVDASSFS